MSSWYKTLTLAVAAIAFTATGTEAQRGSAESNGLPLQPGRTIEFTTEEGSWISVDVSPDGQTIVFDLLGDLYTLPIAGGRAQPLSTGMPFDAQPRFSPDGRKVTFVSDRDGGENVWVMNVDGRDATPLTTGKGYRYRSPEFTPDGSYVIASRGGTAKPWMYHVEGGSGIEMISEPSNAKLLGAAFGADPRYVWFAERSGNHTYNAQFPLYQLIVYDRETGEQYTRTSRYGSAFRPTLSPDGQWLVYGSRRDDQTGLRIRNLNSGDERWLAYPVQRDDQESPAVMDVLPGMTFTPDSREIIATYNGQIWRIPVDGSAHIQVPFVVDVALDVGPPVTFEYPVDDSTTFLAQQIRDAVPSPTGDRLAFVAMDHLWVMDYPEGTPRRVTRDTLTEHHPSWSPDGRTLAYVTWSEVDGGHINRVNAAPNSSPRRLTTRAGYYTSPAWSPDGARIVAIRTPALNFQRAIARGGSSNGSDIVYVGADGGAVTVVAPAGGLARPHFTAQLDRIYAFSSDDGLVSMRWDGSDRKRHLSVTGGSTPGSSNPVEASLILMAPRGDQALALVVNDLYAVTVPPIPSDPQTISVSNTENASFPARKLTDIGAQFPAWASNGRRIHWSIGAAHFVFDLDSANAAERVAVVETPAEDEPQEILTPEQADSLAASEDQGASEDGEYNPSEHRLSIAVERDIPRGTVVLRGARVITMRGDEVIPDADVVVTNNRIESVARRGAVPTPEGADIIDVSETTIIPGFVDTHAHLRPMYEVHKTQVWSYLANLAYGVTTTRDPQTFTTDVLSYADMVEAGEILGPRIYSTGPGVFGSEMIRDAEHASNVLRRYSDYYDTQTIKMYGAGNREQRQWIIMAAREQRLMPTTEGALDFKNNLINTIDGYPGMEHSLPIYPLFGDVVRLFAETRRVYTPTLLVAYGGPWAENYFYATEDVHDDPKLRRFTPHEEVDAKTLRRGSWFARDQHVFDDHARFVRDLIAAGGRAGVGSHGQLQGLGYHWELWAMQSGGLSEHDALRVATMFGADAIGLANDLGSIERGKLADLIVLEDNPLDNIRATNTIRYVMKNGRLYVGDTLDELWPTPTPMGSLPWQTER